MTKIKFNGSNCFRDKRVVIRNTEKVKEKASFFVEKVLNRK